MCLSERTTDLGVISYDYKAGAQDTLIEGLITPPEDPSGGKGCRFLTGKKLKVLGARERRKKKESIKRLLGALEKLSGMP